MISRRRSAATAARYRGAVGRQRRLRTVDGGADAATAAADHADLSACRADVLDALGIVVE